MKNSFWQSAVTYGFIIGLGLIILSLVDWRLGFYGQNFAFSLLSYVAIIGGLVWGALAYRKQTGGVISYGTLISFSLVAVVVYTLVSGLFSLLLTQVIEPSYMEKTLAILEDSLIAKGIPDHQINMIMEATKKLAGLSMLGSFFVSILMGGVISLITSAFIQRKSNFGV
ncbi:MAG: DUF4199 domain-containing protein [Prevotellaceae bacterium]|jgi:hypothetical protein|nr:DUF4199 domain-containing protein [Prevotellaceae bacterium]